MRSPSRLVTSEGDAPQDMSAPGGYPKFETFHTFSPFLITKQGASTVFAHTSSSRTLSAGRTQSKNTSTGQKGKWHIPPASKSSANDAGSRGRI